MHVMSIGRARLLAVPATRLSLALSAAGLAGTAWGQACPAGPVAVNNTACTVTPSSSITVSTANVAGLSATGGAAQITANGVIVRTTGGNDTGALAQNGATIVLGGASSITTIGQTVAGAAIGSHGLQAGSGGVITGDGIGITVSGARSNGVYVDGTARVELTGSTITTSSSGQTDTAPSAGVSVGAGGRFAMRGAGSAITASGVRDHGVSVRAADATASVSDALVTVTGDRSRAIDVFGGGQVGVSNSRLVVTGLGLLGAEVAGAGSSFDMGSQSSITTDRKNGLGVRASADAVVTLTDASVTTGGADATALSAGTGATIHATRTAITTTGDDTSMGAVADLGGTIALTDASVTTSGRRVRGSDTKPHALVARNPGASLTATRVDVRTLGADGQAIGAVADDGGTLTLVDGTISTEGTVGLGLFSVVEQAGPQFAAHIGATGTQIQTSGVRGYGADVERNFLEAPATIALDRVSITTTGESGVGLRARTGGALSASNTTVATHGTLAHGVLARDAQGALFSSIALNQTQVTSDGSTAHGVVVQEGAQVTGNGATVNALGPASAALFVGGETGPAPVASFSGSRLANRSGPTIGVAGAGTISLANTVVSGSGQWLRVGTIDDFPPLVAAEPPLGGAPDIPDPDAVPLATPDVLKSSSTAATLAAGKPGLALIDASASTLDGSALTAAGSVSNVVLRNATLWNLTGNSNITELTNSASQILFSAPAGGAFKTLTVVRYGGQGGIIGLNTHLGADGSPSDKLVIDGGSATGSTGLRITNAGGAGAFTQANGILVVDAINGATTQAGAFALSGRAVAGPYEYRLFRSSQDASNPEAWYLRSEQSIVPPTPPAPTPDVLPPTPAPTAKVPLYRPEVGAYLANQRMAAGMFVHSLHDRLGEPQWIEHQTFEQPDDKRRSGWLRVVGKDIDASSRDGNFDVDTRSWLIHGGGDIASWSVFKDKDKSPPDRLHLGAMLGYGSADSDATALGNPATASGKSEGWNLGAYGTWYQNDENRLGWYVDLWGTYGWYKNRVEGSLLPEVRYNARALTLSGETGYATRVREDSDWLIEPQAQLIYLRYRENDITEPNGTRIDGNDGSGWISRLGLRTHRTWIDEDGRRTQPYLTLNWWHDSVDNALSFNQVALRDLYPDNRYEAKLGINALRDKGWSYWGNLGYQWGSQGYRAVSLRVGAKRSW